MLAIFPRARSWYTPSVLSLWRKSRLHHRRPTWSPLCVIPLDVDELGEGALRRLITKSTQSLMGDISTIFCADPEQLAKTRSASSKSSGRSHAYPRTSLTTLLRISRYSSLTASTSARRSSRARSRPASIPTMTITFCVDISWRGFREEDE